MSRIHFRSGQKVQHPAFGTGLVVEVRTGADFDILEVVFPSGSRRLSSNTPQLLPLKPGEDAGESPARARRPVPEGEAPAPEAETVSADDPGGVSFDEASATILGRLEARNFDPAEIFRLRLQAEELIREQGFQRLVCLALLRDVERFPHQEAACLRVLREMRGRSVLADEVGLGKTIEAGIILKEYLVRGLIQRVLILAPVSLCVQWQEEMARKFGLQFEIQATGRDWSDAPLLISSIERAKMPRRRSAVMEVPYDLVVVDEAHRLRNQRTLNRQLVAELAPPYLLLLTATPVQNDLRELYNLVSLVRPGALGTWRGFKRDFMLRGDPRTPARPERLRDLLRGVMVRTTRASAGLALSTREVEMLQLSLSPEERALYDAVSEYAGRQLARSGATQGEHLSLLVLQKEMGSSARAASRTLRAMAAKGRADADREELTRLAVMADGVRDSSKLEALRGVLSRDGEKVVVFTQFLATLEVLQEEMKRLGIEAAVFHGGLDESEKEAAVEHFRRKARVLLSSEAGGEGRNLQFSHVLVNYDLPWNPMRVEQRIGRVHRLGQRHTVRIFNLAAEDTIESYVLQTLYQKIRLFELVVGEVENILSQLKDAASLEDRVFRAWHSSPRTEQRRRQFERLADEFLVAQRRDEQLRSLDEALLDEA